MAGRKSKWDELEMDDKLLLVEGWARDGYTDRDMMNSLGVSHDTFYKWKKDKPEFADALKKGKEIIDRQVENALLKRALGYSYDEVKEQQTADGTFFSTTTKEVVPDTTAQIFWLKNRRPDKWRDKQDLNHSGQMNHSVDMSGLTTEELRALAKRKSADGE